MKSEDMIKEQACGVRSSCCGGCWCEVSHLGKSVNEHYNCIKSSLGLGKLDDEVHGDLFPWVCQDGQWLEESTWYLLTGFDALA